MSEADTIRVNIDDSELDAAIAKIQTMISLSEEVAGKDVGGRPGAKGLPGINRELRLILGQIPGIREAIQVYFRLSRMVRGFHAGNINLYVTLLATAILIVNRIMDRQRQMERQQQEYEQWIRKERRVSKEQYMELTKTWEDAARSRPG